MRNIIQTNLPANSGYKKKSFSTSFSLFGVSKFMKKARRSLRLDRRDSAINAFSGWKMPNDIWPKRPQ